MNEDLTAKVEQVLRAKLTSAEKLARLTGRKGLITQELRRLKDLPAGERARQGAFLNELKRQVADRLSEKTVTEQKVDFSAPPANDNVGSKHPINAAIDEMVDIFSRLGFEVVTGPEIVSDYDNFGSLNFPDDHPARDTQDSFLIKGFGDLLLRTQTSAMQVPTMKERTAPIRVIVPGKTFRREADATHQPMFNQLEGFIVDTKVTFADLKGLLKYFVDNYFGADMPLRFRPHYFPFTEPSAELDILWQKEDGSQQWLEILGCGSIHPQVLENAGLNPRQYQGIAFGFGVERPFMLKHHLDDMRLLYDNQESFLKQFSAL